MPDTGMRKSTRLKLIQISKEQRKVRQARIAMQQKRQQAGYAVQKAVASGLLVRQPCEVCNAPKAEAHHEDYDKPLEVVWLCRKHHMNRHAEIKRTVGPNYKRLLEDAQP